MSSLGQKDIILNSEEQVVNFFTAGVESAGSASASADEMEIFDLGRFEATRLKRLIATRGSEVVQKSSLFDAALPASITVDGTQTITPNTVLNVRFNIVAADPAPDLIRWDLLPGNTYREYQVVLQPGDIDGVLAAADAGVFLTKLAEQIQAEVDFSLDSAILIPTLTGSGATTKLEVTSNDNSLYWTVDVVDDNEDPSPIVTVFAEDPAQSTEFTNGSGNYVSLRDKRRIQNPLLTDIYYPRADENPIRGKLYSTFSFAYDGSDDLSTARHDVDIKDTKEPHFVIFVNEDILATTLTFIANFLDNAPVTEYYDADKAVAANVAAFLA